MTTEKKPHRRLCRRQKYLRVPIGVNFRQQHLQRAINTTLRHLRVKTAAMKMESKMKRVTKSLEKEREELRQMQARFPQLMAERIQALDEKMHALEESAWTQVWSDTLGALFIVEA